MNWEVLYSVLKMTREGKDNAPIDDMWYMEQIQSLISIHDIEKMSSNDVKTAVINYLNAVAPSIRRR